MGLRVAAGGLRAGVECAESLRLAGCRRVAGGCCGEGGAESLRGGGCGRSVENTYGKVGESWVAVLGGMAGLWLEAGDSLYGSGESPNF